MALASNMRLLNVALSIYTNKVEQLKILIKEKWKQNHTAVFYEQYIKVNFMYLHSYLRE